MKKYKLLKKISLNRHGFQVGTVYDLPDELVLAFKNPEEWFEEIKEKPREEGRVLKTPNIGIGGEDCAHCNMPVCGIDLDEHAKQCWPQKSKSVAAIILDICQGVKGDERDVEEERGYQRRCVGCDRVFYVTDDVPAACPDYPGCTPGLQPKQECMSTLTRVFLQKLKDYYPGKEFKLVEDGAFTKLLFADTVVYIGILGSAEPSLELLNVLDQHFSK